MNGILEKLRRPSVFWTHGEHGLGLLLKYAADEIERLDRCLRIAAGIVSTTKQFEARHPDEALSWIEEEEKKTRDVE